MASAVGPTCTAAVTSRRKQKVHWFLLHLIPHQTPTHKRHKKMSGHNLYWNLYQRVFGMKFRDFRSQLLEINGCSTKSLKSKPSGSGPKVGGEGRQGRICKELQVFLMWSMYGDGIWLQAHFLIRKKKQGQVVGIFFIFSVCARRGGWCVLEWCWMAGWFRFMYKMHVWHQLLGFNLKKTPTPREGWDWTKALRSGSPMTEMPQRRKHGIFILNGCNGINKVYPSETSEDQKILAFSLSLPLHVNSQLTKTWLSNKRQITCSCHHRFLCQI